MSSGRFGLPSSTEDDNGQTLVLPMILSGLCLLALGLVLVWFNLERAKLSYKLNTLQREMRTRSEYHTKVLIEREHMLSPSELGKKAGSLGLHAAKPGQLRRLEGPKGAPIRQ